MSARYEVGAADWTPVGVAARGDEGAEALELEPGEYALVIGVPWASAYAVTGTPDELRAFVAGLSRTVNGLPE